MAESNTTRFSLRQWSAGTDTPQRTEFSTSFLNIETLGAIYKQGTFAARPVAGVVGTFYWDTTNSYLWYDNGSAWLNIGSRAQDAIIKSSVVGNVPLALDTPASQTADLFQLKVNGTIKAKFDKDGNATVGTLAGVSAAFVNATAGNVVLAAKGATSQSAALLALTNVSDTNMFSVSQTGTISGAFFAQSATNAVHGGPSNTNVANMSFWSGNAALEVKTKGGTGAFNDFLYLQHDTVSGSAAIRRLGVLMKTGAEASGDAARSAAMYLWSNAANGDNPQLRFDVRDLNMWQMDPTSGSVTGYPVYANGSYLRANPSGTAAVQAGNTYIGVQGSANKMYLRAATTSDGFYFYAGGVHSDTTADAGSGGATLGTLLPSGSGSLLTVGRGSFSQDNDATLAQSNPSLMVGAANGLNTIMSSSKIVARNNGANSALEIQPTGGEVRIGTAAGHNYWGDNNFFIGFDPPAFKDTNTLWIDISYFGDGGGVYRWSAPGSVWVKCA